MSDQVDDREPDVVTCVPHHAVALGSLPTVPDAVALGDALAARDQFIANVSSELRNSVAPLILLADHFSTLVAETADTKLPSRVGLLTKHLHRFVATIDRVTEIAHLRDGNLDLEISYVDMAAEVGDVIARMNDQAFASGVELVLHTTETASGWWDRARVHQIVANLLSNAIRYGGSGTVEITVRRSNGDAELEVRDRGPGIPPHEVGRVFDRLDHVFSRSAGGFGVGLFVVKTLAVAMGGSVGVENDGGAVFRVFLPRG